MESIPSENLLEIFLFASDIGEINKYNISWIFTSKKFLRISKSDTFRKKLLLLIHEKYNLLTGKIIENAIQNKNVDLLYLLINTSKKYISSLDHQDLKFFSLNIIKIFYENIYGIENLLNDNFEIIYHLYFIYCNLFRNITEPYSKDFEKMVKSIENMFIRAVNNSLHCQKLNNISVLLDKCQFNTKDVKDYFVFSVFNVVISENYLNQIISQCLRDENINLILKLDYNTSKNSLNKNLIGKIFIKKIVSYDTNNYIKYIKLENLFIKIYYDLENCKNHIKMTDGKLVNILLEENNNIDTFYEYCIDFYGEILKLHRDNIDDTYQLFLLYIEPWSNEYKCLFYLHYLNFITETLLNEKSNFEKYQQIIDSIISNNEFDNSIGEMVIMNILEICKNWSEIFMFDKIIINIMNIIPNEILTEILFESSKFKIDNESISEKAIELAFDKKNET